jgi:UDP-N-acetyl-D-mannosaminuronate dehydrogenase
MKGLILGAGEVGGAYYEVLRNRWPVWRRDVKPGLSDRKIPKKLDILHVCLRFDEHFEATVGEYAERHRVGLINVMSTVPPGTTDDLGVQMRLTVTHSTTRGLHPNLAQFIRVTPKHIGGSGAEAVAAYFRAAGVECITHPKACTTELAHILGNVAFAAAAAFADEAEALCREYGVDYYDAVMRYAETHNLGYERMGMKSKMRPVVWPAGGRIGGHCFVQNAQLIPKETRGKIMSLIADYNESNGGAV